MANESRPQHPSAAHHEAEQKEGSDHIEGQTPTKQERIWGTFTHLSGLLVYFGIPFANILAPIALWLWKKPDMPFINEQGKQAINFNISITLYFMGSMLLFTLSMIPMMNFIAFLATLLMFALGIAHVSIIVYAALQANEGEHFEYPFTIPFFR